MRVHRWKQAMGWITLALIFGGVGLSIFGAFLSRLFAGMHSYAQ